MDDERVIPKETAEKFKKDFQLDFFLEASAKTGINTKEIFVEIATLLYTDFCKFGKKKSNEGEQLKPRKLTKLSKKKKKCC